MGFWRTMLIALVSFGLLIALIMPALNRYILHPIVALSRGVAEISSGNFDHQVSVNSQDELGELAGSFDKMRGQLKKNRLLIPLAGSRNYPPSTRLGWLLPNCWIWRRSWH